MLDVRNISVIFNQGTPNEKVALDNVSLHLDEGDFVTVIGGNGAGKSTLLNSIAGTLNVASGNICIDGKDVTRLPDFKRAGEVARVFQDPMKGTASSMNIEENLALAMSRGKRRTLKWNVTNAESHQFKQMLIQLNLGLDDRLDCKVSLLSGGQPQALTLLMATINKPKLLLLDEHTAALDPGTASKVLAMTESITSENNQTTLMITHNMRDALQYGNRLIMMHNGRIIFQAQGEEKKKLTVQDLLNKFATLGEENDRIMLAN